MSILYYEALADGSTILYVQMPDQRRAIKNIAAWLTDPITLTRSAEFMTDPTRPTSRGHVQEFVQE
jgi:hypothetical protein